MRRYIFALLLSCLYLCAWAQMPDDIDLSGLPKPTQAESLRYWFDNDIGSLQATSQLNGKQTIDVATLLEGVHTIHYQIVDNTGNVSTPYSAIFIKLSQSQSSIAVAASLRYWFDTETSTNSTNVVGGISTIDVTRLLDGVHTIHYQVVDNNGVSSYIASGIFIKMKTRTEEVPVSAKNLLYWFDNETEEIKTTEVETKVQFVDASYLENGVHTLHYQILCSDGSITPTYSSIFLKLDISTDSSSAKSLEYWFDSETSRTQTQIADGVQMLDVSNLVQGVHTLHYQIINNDNSYGSIASSIFIKMGNIISESTKAKKQRYWFDDDKSTVIEEDVVSGVQMLDVSRLLTGVHTLHYQLLDEQGNVSVPYSAIFMKMFEQNIPEGGNVITKYMYWVNDNTKDIEKVEIENPTSPYNLVSLLPVAKAPIRSSSFHFEVTDGKPMMYAKNDFHVRFYDATGYWIDDAKPFIDYSVSQEVTDIFELQSTQTFACPAENTVRWYKFNAEVGDTVALKSSQATSIQVFSPSGKEVYSASGDKAVKFDGCHTWEDGTYYVAVHDVTGTKPDITLDYVYISEFILGDANCDKIIDVADNATIASYILGLPTKIFRRRAADFNLDNDVDVADITTIIDVIFESDAKEDIDLASDPGKQELIAKSGESCLQLKLANTGNEFSAFQTDIYLPAGVEVEKITTDTKHNIVWRRVAENTVRVMIYSLANETFSVGNDLLNLVLRGQEQLAEINIVNGIAARPDGSKEKILDCSSLVSISNPSGIESIQQETDEQIYNVRGQKLQKSGRGVNIIRSDNDTRKVMKQ